MSVARTSGLSALRSGLRSVRTPLVRPGLANQVRYLTHDKDTNDLGGPYGQSKIPERPGGADAIRRNWMRAAAGALFVLGLVAYATRKPKNESGKPLRN